MWQGVDESNDAKREAAEQRSHKILVLDAIQQKHAKRSARATKSARSNEHADRFGVFCKTVQYQRPPPRALQGVFCWLLRQTTTTWSVLTKVCALLTRSKQKVSFARAAKAQALRYLQIESPPADAVMALWPLMASMKTCHWVFGCRPGLFGNQPKNQPYRNHQPAGLVLFATCRTTSGLCMF